MILAIDIGNSNIVIGCIEGRTEASESILFRERVSTNQLATELEYASAMKTAFDMYGIDKNKIDGAIISSVVPSVTGTLKKAVEKFSGVKAKVVGPGMKTGISIAIESPAQLGSDLVVDAVAGIYHYHQSLPLIIIDMGTATTLSVISEHAEYIGGLIVPGLAISHEALVSRTAQLPKVALEPPKRLIGKNTVECLKSGLLYGCAGQIDSLIDRIQEEIGKPCTVVATGGLAGVVIPLCKHGILLDDALLLKGLFILYNKNK